MSYDPALGAADAALQRAFDSIEASGLEVFEPERVALSHATEAGHLPALEHLIRRALLIGSTESQAAAQRRWVRAHRTDADRAPAEAAAPTSDPIPDWVLTDGGTAFRHPACGHTERGFVDDVQARAAARIHHDTCPAVARG